jgi:hypothetical protein
LSLAPQGNGRGAIADPVKIITAVSWDRCPKSAAGTRQPRRGGDVRKL